GNILSYGRVERSASHARRRRRDRADPGGVPAQRPAPGRRGSARRRPRAHQRPPAGAGGPPPRRGAPAGAARRPRPGAHAPGGLPRQAVRRLVNGLAAAGWVEFAPNPHPRRATLVLLTSHGRDAYRAALDRQIPWANRLAEALDERDVAAATRVARALTRQL